MLMLNVLNLILGLLIHLQQQFYFIWMVGQEIFNFCKP